MQLASNPATRLTTNSQLNILSQFPPHYHTILAITMHQSGSLICNEPDKLMVKMTILFLLCKWLSIRCYSCMHTTFGFNTLRNTQKRQSLHACTRVLHSRKGGTGEWGTSLLVAMCTVKRFRLLQSYIGYLSCIPFVYMRCKVQGVFRI